MKETSSVVAEEIPALGITFVGNLPGNRQLSLQTHVASTVPAADLDQMLDKLRVAYDRQEAIYSIERLTIEYKQQKQLLVDHRTRMEIVNSRYNLPGRRVDPTTKEPVLPKQEAQAREQAKANAELAKNNVLFAREQLEKAYKKAGMEVPEGIFSRDDSA